jgi:hypothetical protein
MSVANPRLRTFKARQLSPRAPAATPSRDGPAPPRRTFVPLGQLLASSTGAPPVYSRSSSSSSMPPAPSRSSSLDSGSSSTTTATNMTLAHRALQGPSSRNPNERKGHEPTPPQTPHLPPEMVAQMESDRMWWSKWGPDRMGIKIDSDFKRKPPAANPPDEYLAQAAKRKRQLSEEARRQKLAEAIQDQALRVTSSHPIPTAKSLEIDSYSIAEDGRVVSLAEPTGRRKRKVVDVDVHRLMLAKENLHLVIVFSSTFT